MATKQIRFDDINRAITQAHFDQFASEIIGSTVPILGEGGKRYAIAKFDSKATAEGIFSFINEFATTCIFEVTGVEYVSPFKISYCLSREEELRKIERHERIRKLESEKRKLLETEQKRQEKKAQREELRKLTLEVLEMAELVGELELDEENRQIDIQLANAEKEEALTSEYQALKRAVEAKRKLENLQQDKRDRDRLKSKIDILKMAADVEAELPKWDDEASWSAYETVMVEWYTVSSLTADSKLTKVREESAQMRMKAKPFGRGTFRLAFYAQLKRGGVVSKVVAKSFLSDTVSNTELLDNIETQLLAQRAAELFCAANKATVVEYVEPMVVRGAKQDYFVEPWLNGIWKRFTNNKGDVSIAHKAPTITAFCHYSYQISEGYMIVVDIQGVCTTAGYQLTDPAVQSDNRKYGDSNLGATGFVNFFETHECNTVCKKLGLTRHPKQVKADNMDTIPDRT